MPTPHKYIIVTGFADSGKSEPKLGGLSAIRFFPIWMKNTRSDYRLIPKIYVVSSSRTVGSFRNIEWINAGADLGHLGNLPQGQQLTGWSASFLMGCLLAFHNRADLIYKEQDCLAFGPWLDRLYDEIGDHGMITGHRNDTGGNDAGGPAAGLTAQSLVLVKNRYLLPFVTRYLSIPETDGEICNESKFDLIARDGETTQTTMGYDRSRPVNYSDEAFYMQQISAAELESLRERGLV